MVDAIERSLSGGISESIIDGYGTVIVRDVSQSMINVDGIEVKRRARGGGCGS